VRTRVSEMRVTGVRMQMQMRWDLREEGRTRKIQVDNSRCNPQEVKVWSVNLLLTTDVRGRHLGQRMLPRSEEFGSAKNPTPPSQTGSSVADRRGVATSRPECRRSSHAVEPPPVAAVAASAVRR
jgi:hypothetical protein